MHASIPQRISPQSAEEHFHHARDSKENSRGKERPDPDALGKALGDDHDLVVLRVRLIDLPQPGITQADLGALTALVDHRHAALHAEASLIGRRF